MAFVADGRRYHVIVRSSGASGLSTSYNLQWVTTTTCPADVLEGTATVDLGAQAPERAVSLGLIGMLTSVGLQQEGVLCAWPGDEGDWYSLGILATASAQDLQVTVSNDTHQLTNTQPLRLEVRVTHNNQRTSYSSMPTGPGGAHTVRFTVEPGDLVQVRVHRADPQAPWNHAIPYELQCAPAP